jgi:hypothetical protein
MFMNIGKETFLHIFMVLNKKKSFVNVANVFSIQLKYKMAAMWIEEYMYSKK